MAHATTVTYTFTDAKAKRSIAKLNIPSTTAFADLVPFAQAAAALYEALCHGLISKASINIPLSYTLTSAGALSDVQKRGLFTFHDATGLIAKVVVPT